MASVASLRLPSDKVGKFGPAISNGENSGDSWVVKRNDQPIIWMYIQVGKWMEQQVNQSVPMINCGWQITVANWIWNHFYLCDFGSLSFRSFVQKWLPGS